MPLITVDQLRQIAPRCDAGILAPLLDAWGRAYGISTPLSFNHWLAQMLAETGGLVTYTENLNYSAEALLRVFPSHFGPALADTYAHKPEQIANRVYANRLGNGDEASGDGWKYRGRGALQITGKMNYAAEADHTGLDLVTNPDLLGGVGAPAIEAAAVFWTLHGISALAEKDDIVAVTRAVNGGLNGLLERKSQYANVCAVLALPPPVERVEPPPSEPAMPIDADHPALNPAAPDPTPDVPTIPSVTAMNYESFARFALGAGAAWLVTHHVLPGNDAAEQLVNIFTPILLAAAAAVWTIAKNELHKQHMVALLNASPPEPAVK